MNRNYIKYNLSKLLSQIKLNSDITSDNIHITKNDTSIEIEIRNLLNIDGCDKLLRKIKNNLNKLDYYLSYKNSESYGVILTGDEGLDIETDYSRKYYNILLHIKKKYIQRKVAPKYLYHGTFYKNLEGIKQNGILPSKLTNYTEGIHLEYDNLLFTTKNLDYILHRYEVAIKVDVSTLPNKWFKDLNLPLNDELYMSDVKIPPNSIVEIFEL